ncbi:27237_t:CDS:2 [Gigaspora margarita]|uniref:27237_t:CDS:1 n=1 Tax=Gigaspora margarita TaxID=4874 RepID=A0ABM8VVF4_GIGMA|nr:27237_t:CDS:2 [Gigaspora margarita]
MLKIIEEIKNLIEEMNTKTSQELDLETVKNRLGEIVAKNQQAVTDQGVEKLQNEISELREKTEQVKQIILELPDFTEKKEEISAQSIQASDKILIEKIAEEFAKKRLEGKTLQVNFLDGSGFEIGIDISEEKNRIPVFRSLAHELAHNVILLKELKGKQSENDISTLEFVRSKLLPEDQKELDDFIKIENKEGGNKIARRTVLQLVDDSMNTPANEAEERLIQVEVWTRTESKQSSDHGKFKIYVFHNYDSELPADLKKKLDEVLITDEKGE